MPDVAIAHKDYDVRGGGERLAEELADTFDAPMYVGRRDPENVPERTDLDIRELEHSRLAKWAIDRGGVARAFAYQQVWQRPDELPDHDTVILSGNEPLWYVPPDEQTVVAYTHSTPRFHYDLFHDREGHLQRLYSLAVRVMYDHNVRRPDLYVANSDLVARRIHRYWNIPRQQIDVVYPPVPVDTFDPAAALTGDYYLYLGRLAGHKNVDELVEAFLISDDDRTLKIAGRGPARDDLEERAGDDPSVEFLGYVDEERKRELLAGARAFLFAADNEDFGMAPIEAMASGTPVIAARDGFTKYQVINGANGLLYPRGPSGCIRAVRRLERDGVAWEPARIREFARRFDVDQFRDGIRDAVERARQRADIAPAWELELTLEGELDDVDVDVDREGEVITEPAATDGGREV